MFSLVFEQKQIDVVLLTAARVELDAVLRWLEPFPGAAEVQRRSIGKETYYLGRFGLYSAAVTMCAMGSAGRNSAILATVAAIGNWKPRAVIVVGIAFGKDPESQRVATVLVSERVICYEPQRVGEKRDLEEPRLEGGMVKLEETAAKIQYRGAIAESGLTLLNRFQNVRDWQFVRPDGSTCEFEIGPILSGEKLIDDPRFKAHLFEHFTQAIGGEMEGAGVYAASDYFDAEWIIVKAISDWADGNKAKKDENQPLAAAAAVSLVHHVLSEPDALPETQSSLSHRHRRGSVADSDLISYNQVRNACYKVTRRSATLIIDNQPIISRERFSQGLDEFLESGARYCFLLGPSGVGKSVLMAVEALRLFERGWTSLFLSGASYSVDKSARLLAEELSFDVTALSFRQIIEPLIRTDDSAGLAILINAVDIPDPDQIASELLALHELISDAPLGRLKVIVSCRDISWDKLSRHSLMPIYRDATRLGRQSHVGFLSIEVSDFTPTELDAALEKIEAKELVVTGDIGKQSDLHIQALRDLLKHPATFEHYANLHASQDLSSIPNLTWSTLIRKSIEESLAKASRRCRMGVEPLQEQLVRFVSKAWDIQARGFALSRNTIGEDLRTMLFENTGAASPYEALLETGVLIETADAGANSTISFRVMDAGAYFLSIELERRVNGKTVNESSEIVGEWLKQAWNYYPLLDAMLAWIDRLVDDPFDPRLLNLLALMVKSHHFHSDSLFRLMRPAVMASIFEIVKRAPSEDFYSYRDAAREIRSSPEAVRTIRDHVKDPNVHVRELATELVGIHGDIETLPELVDLFQDLERDVRHEVYGAFRRVGKPAIEILLKTLNDSSQSPELHSHCLSALRGAGYRDDRISATLQRCLQNADNENDAVLHSAFLAAAYFRDEGHTAAAVKALKHKSEDVIQAAAKYLAEVPVEAAFDAINEALRPKQSAADQNWKHHFLSRQLIAALVSANPDRAAPVIIQLIRSGLHGQGELHPVEAIWVAKKFGPSEVYALILERAVSELEEKPARIVCVAAEALAEVWRSDDLAVLGAAEKDYADQGVDIAPRFVDAVARGMDISEGYRLADQLSQVSDLRGVMKSQAATLIPEASRLLAKAKAWNVDELCEILWVAGDSRAEHAVILKLENPISEGSGGWYERSNIARALGTCGMMHGWHAILDYLRTEENISRYFYAEALCPLVMREIISTDDLARVVEDVSYGLQGRTTCILALSKIAGAAYQDLFIRVANTATEDLLQRYAVRMLGLNGDRSVGPALIQLLRASTDPSVKSQAAESLGWLGVKNAAQDIERALHDSPDAGSIGALARLQQESSLPLILDGLRKGPGEYYRDYLKAVAAFSRYRQGREAIDAQFAEWAHGKQSLFDDQTPLVVGLLQYAPNILLAQASWLIGHGFMTSSARSELAGSIPHLYNDETTDKRLLMETVKGLVCDRQVSIRDRAVCSLNRTSVEFSKELHSELVQSSAVDEWDRACALSLLSTFCDDLSQIERARFDREFLVRRAADEVLATHEKKRQLRTHVERFSEKDGLERLTGYLCLQEQGDLSAVLSLSEKCGKDTLARIFLRNLRHQIVDRLSKEYKEKQEKEDKLEDTRGTIWFD
jgi:nucleoside phosphorylase/HEAT repeat protein